MNIKFGRQLARRTNNSLVRFANQSPGNCASCSNSSKGGRLG